MASVFKIHEAKTHLSKLIARAVAGEEVIIARAGEPQVRLVPVAAVVKPKRVPGTMKGKVWLDDRFFEPLPEDELRRWEGRDA